MMIIKMTAKRMSLMRMSVMTIHGDDADDDADVDGYDFDDERRW